MSVPNKTFLILNTTILSTSKYIRCTKDTRERQRETEGRERERRMEREREGERKRAGRAGKNVRKSRREIQTDRQTEKV